MAKFIRNIMEKIDERFLASANARFVEGTENNLLLICFHPYEGEGADLPDGTVVRPGDLVSELHLSNKKVASYAEGQSKSVEWQIIQDMRKEFMLLAKEVQDGSVPQEVKGFYGVNVMPAGARRLGFTLIPLPPGWNRVWLAWWESVIRRVFYSFKPGKKPDFSKTKVAYEIWMSRGELVKKYGQTSLSSYNQ